MLFVLCLSLEASIANLPGFDAAGNTPVTNDGSVVVGVPGGTSTNSQPGQGNHPYYS